MLEFMPNNELRIFDGEGNPIRLDEGRDRKVKIRRFDRKGQVIFDRDINFALEDYPKAISALTEATRDDSLIHYIEIEEESGMKTEINSFEILKSLVLSNNSKYSVVNFTHNFVQQIKKTGLKLGKKKLVFNVIPQAGLNMIIYENSHRAVVTARAVKLDESVKITSNDEEKIRNKFQEATRVGYEKIKLKGNDFLLHAVNTNPDFFDVYIKLPLDFVLDNDNDETITTIFIGDEDYSLARFSIESKYCRTRKVEAREAL